MATKTLLTKIALRRDTDVNYIAKGSTFVPLKGEVCFVDVAGKGLKAKVGDGITAWENLPYTDEYLLEAIDQVVLTGYYLNSNFYTDSTYTVELEKSVNKIYIDRNSNTIFHFDGTQYVSINETLPTASEDRAGIVKLYQNGGSNTDGTMSQKAITEGVQSIQFTVDTEDTECLVLDLPWESNS